MEFSETFKQEIFKKLSYKSRKPPSERTCKSRIEFATAIVASIAKDPTQITAKLAMEIIKAVQIYLENAMFPPLDKLILKLTSKVYIPEMLELIKTTTDPEIIAGKCYVKYKNEGILDESIFQVYGMLEGEIRYRIDRLFGKVLVDRIPDLITSVDVSPVIDTDLKRRAEYYSLDGVKFSLNDGSVFQEILSKDHIWNDFSGYKVLSQKYRNKEFERIMMIIKMIDDSKLRDARAELLLLVRTTNPRHKLMIYNLLAYVHFLILEFQESNLYIDLYLEIATGFDWEFGMNCRFLLERYAQVPSVFPLLHVDFSKAKQIILCDRSFLLGVFENKLLCREIMSTSFERIGLYCKNYTTTNDIEDFFAKFRKNQPEFTILFVFIDGSNLCLYNITDKSHCKAIDWSEIVLEFDEIMQENRSILSMKALTAEEKRFWWSSRIALDLRLEKIVSRLRSLLNVKVNGRVFLILEDSASFFPFEMVFEKPTIRVLSQNLPFGQVKVSEKTVMYLLDPGNNLINTRLAITKYFESKNLQGVKGIVGRPLSKKEMQEAKSIECFMYFGHGNGKKYFDFHDSDPRMLFLFGCSSCRLLKTTNFRSNGFCLRHLKRKRAVLGNLWDVTDKDLDRYTVAILDDFFAGKGIVESVFENRKICKLKYLNAAALVIYGKVESSSS